MNRLRWFAPASALILALLGSVSAEASGITSLTTHFDDGTFGGWTVDGNRAGAFGVGTKGKSLGGAYDVFGPMQVNTRSGNSAAYALVSSTYGESLGLSRAVDLEPGSYDVGYFLGADAPGKPRGIMGFNSVGNTIMVNGKTLEMLSKAAIPNGNTPTDFQAYYSEFTTTGGPTKIDLKITGSGFGRSLLSIDDIFVRPVVNTPSPQLVPEPASLAVLGVGVLGWLAWRRRSRVA